MKSGRYAPIISIDAAMTTIIADNTSHLKPFGIGKSFMGVSFLNAIYIYRSPVNTFL